MSAISSAYARILRHWHPKRWVGVCIVSVLLHFMLLQWAGLDVGLPAFNDQKASIIQTTLRAAPAEPLASALRSTKVKSAPAAPKARVPAALPATTPPESASPESASPESEHVSSSVAPVTTTPAEPTPAAPRHTIKLPPSAELHYDVQVFKSDSNYSGSGTINWQTDGKQYAIDGVAKALIFLTVLSFNSTGTIAEEGLMPLLYTEKPFKKSATNTHFNRERNTISFSASTLSYPRTGIEQDRVSIIWQLVGMGRGDPAQFTPGAEINVFVAGVRDGEIWHIQVVGEETIELSNGATKTWHLVRVPRQGSYDKQLDVWLSPLHDWQPARMRYTETNGDYMDLSLSFISPAAAR